MTDSAILADDGSFSFFDAVLEGFSLSEEEACADDAPTDAMDEEEFKRAYERLYGCTPPFAHSAAPAPDESLEREYDRFYGTSPLSSPPSSTPPSRPSSPSPISGCSKNSPLDSIIAASNVHDHPSPSTPKDPTAATEFAGCPKLSNKKLRNKRKMHERRREKRRNEREQSLRTGEIPASTSAANRIQISEEQQTEYDVSDIPSGTTGYKARADTKGRVYSADELLNGLGFTLVKAERSGAAQPIVDKNGLIIAVVVGQPRDPGWTAVHREAHSLLLGAGERCRVSSQSRHHRRGNFLALNAGISFGGGQKAPGNLVHSPHNTIEVEKLLSSDAFTRIARFGSSAFATWAPNLHQYYSNSFKNLLESNSNLRRNFNGTVWAAAAFNCGPQTTCAKHRDYANLPFGWCSVTALGEFDHQVGGHVVLWEAKLVVELPPGHTILLPSAAVAHSNTPIRPGETRTSFTQFSAGGVFRWAEHGFQTETKYRAGMSADQLAQVAADNLARTKLGLKLFSKLNELRQPQRHN